MEEKAMKKLLALLSLSLIAISLQAYYPHHNNHSELVIRLYDGGAFNITIDNRSYNQMLTSYTIPSLAPGRHFVQIVRFDSYYNGYSYSYGPPIVVFSGHISISARSRIYAHISHRNRFVVDSRMPLTHYQPGQPGYGNGYGYGQGHDYGHGGYYQPVMSPQAFSYLKSTIVNTSFDSSKLEIAKQAVRSNRVSSQQVYELVSLMTFESNKLDLAMFAYRFTVDKGSYFIVNNAFSFSSSISKLNHFIATNQY
jgi:hypothetical protein